MASVNSSALDHMTDLKQKKSETVNPTVLYNASETTHSRFTFIFGPRRFDSSFSGLQHVLTLRKSLIFFVPHFITYKMSKILFCAQ